MDVIITEWALQSYLDLKANNVFTVSDYRTKIRPDAELLKQEAGLPFRNPKFANSRFWGPATDRNGNSIPSGFKMKWHNLGPGRVQLRLAVALLQGAAYLCTSYVKDSPATDKRQMANFKIHIQRILQGTHIERGRL